MVQWFIKISKTYQYRVHTDVRGESHKFGKVQIRLQKTWRDRRCGRPRLCVTLSVSFRTTDQDESHSTSYNRSQSQCRNEVVLNDYMKEITLHEHSQVRYSTVYEHDRWSIPSVRTDTGDSLHRLQPIPVGGSFTPLVRVQWTSMFHRTYTSIGCEFFLKENSFWKKFTVPTSMDKSKSKTGIRGVC